MKEDIFIDNEKINMILNNFLDKCSETIVTEAKRIVPVKIGALRSSIEVKNTDYENKKVTVGSDLKYAKFIEMGTIKISPRAYLRGALDNLTNLLRG